MARTVSGSKVIDDRFQVFKTGFEDVSLVSEEYVEHRPLSQPKRGQRIDITVPKSSGYYYDLSRSYLRVSVKITKSGGGALVPSNVDPSLIDYVALVNNAPLWTAMSFHVGNVDFARESSVLLPYKQNVDMLLYKSKEYLESTAAAAHFFYDTATAMDSNKPSSATGSNAGLLARYNISKNGNYFTLEMPLVLDLSETLKSYIPNKMEIRMSLFPNSESFALITDSLTEQYEIDVDSVVFCLMSVTPRPELLAVHDQRFQKENATFTYEKSVLKSYTIGKGDSQFDLDNVFGHFIPGTMHLMFVTTQSYVGSFNTNPFFYKNLGVSNILFKGEQIPDKTYQPEFSSNNYTTEYMNLYRSPTGQARSGIISMSDFKAGYSIFKIDIAESMFETKTGINRLSVRFKEPLTENTTAIIYGRFPASFQIDASRHIVP